jgi:hypothetical protein
MHGFGYPLTRSGLKGRKEGRKFTWVHEKEGRKGGYKGKEEMP